MLPVSRMFRGIVDCEADLGPSALLASTFKTDSSTYLYDQTACAAKSHRKYDGVTCNSLANFRDLDRQVRAAFHRHAGILLSFNNSS